MRRMLVSAAVLAVLLGGGRAWAQAYSPVSLDRYFALEWQVAPSPGGPVIEGYVHNKRDVGVDRMILSIERLDRTGAVVGRSSVWVLGGVPAGSRAFFRAKTIEAASYRVQVVNFEWAGRGQ